MRVRLARMDAVVWDYYSYVVLEAWPWHLEATFYGLGLGLWPWPWY